MESSKAEKRHIKTLLSGNPESNVTYCQDCKVVEVNLGAMTLRISPESFLSLCSVLNQAKVRLGQLQDYVAVNQPSKVVSGEIVH